MSRKDVDDLNDKELQALPGSFLSYHTFSSLLVVNSSHHLFTSLLIITSSHPTFEAQFLVAFNSNLIYYRRTPS